MDKTTVIIVLGFVFILIVLATTIQLFQAYRRRVRLKPFTTIVGERLERLQYLEKSMDKLYKEHQVIDKLSDAYNLITKYAACRDKTEDDYCKNYLRKLYSSGYKRFDDERAK
ncbi:hypothetical protein ACFLXT_03515 [Chloroflexota bacterium]